MADETPGKPAGGGLGFFRVLTDQHHAWPGQSWPLNYANGIHRRTDVHGKIRFACALGHLDGEVGIGAEGPNAERAHPRADGSHVTIHNGHESIGASVRGAPAAE